MVAKNSVCGGGRTGAVMIAVLHNEIEVGCSYCPG